MKGPGTRKAKLAIRVLICLIAIQSTSAGRDSIRVSDLRRHVRTLADDAMQGRDVGTGPIESAEEYIAAAFLSYGLEPLPGEDDFFIDFDLYRRTYDLEHTVIELRRPDAGRVRAEPAVDFRPFSFSDDGQVEAEVVFAGYGITAPEFDYDDYADIDVTDKIVLILRHEPGERDPESSFDGTRTTEHATFTTKAQAARRAGASAMLLVTDPLHHPPADDLRMDGSLALEPPRPRSEEAEEDGEGVERSFLAFQISQELAVHLVAGSGRTLVELQQAVDEGTTPGQLGPLGCSAALSVTRTDEAERVPARNVAGFLRGSSAELSGEWVVIGGHHDHLGAYSGEGDTVFNGADDNASGVAGVLELAEAIAARKPRPPRSVVFMTFSAEEKGLLGSRALVDQNLLALDPVVFMLNLDMIGRNENDSIAIYGDGYARGMEQRVRAAPSFSRLKNLEFAGTNYAANSDHDVFYRNGIPFLFFFTGIHEDYHQLGDHANKLSYRRMRSILRLARDVVEGVADAADPPSFIHYLSWMGARVEAERRDGGRVAAVTSLDADSRAQQAGLREGDVLVEVNGVVLGSPDEIGARFDEVTPGTELELRVRRGGEIEAVRMERPVPGYLGVMPGRLEDEQRVELGLKDGEGMRLRRVVDDGPAAAGGLEAGDIVLRIDGRPTSLFTLGSSLAQAGAGSEVVVQLIRSGERIERKVTLGERPRRE